MTTLCLTLSTLCLPMALCFAVTRAKREGYPGVRGFYIWALESFAAWLNWQARKQRTIYEMEVARRTA